MTINTVIFDMDGLLIDSEPLWNEAADEVFSFYGKKLSPGDHAQTMGLRTSEFVAWWLRDYNFDETELEKAAHKIVDVVNDKIKRKAKVLPGVHYIINFFATRGFKIGLATSSPLLIVDTVAQLLDIDKYLDAKMSAEHLDYGKPVSYTHLTLPTKRIV